METNPIPETRVTDQLGVTTRPRISEIERRSRSAVEIEAGEKPGYSVAELTKLMEASAGKLAAAGTDVSFSYDPRTHSVTLTVHDPQSGDLIRQIPPDAFIRVAENIDRLLGLIMDKRA